MALEAYMAFLVEAVEEVPRGELLCLTKRRLRVVGNWYDRFPSERAGEIAPPPDVSRVAPTDTQQPQHSCNKTT